MLLLSFLPLPLPFGGGVSTNVTHFGARYILPADLCVLHLITLMQRMRPGWVGA
nr:MAG TPA: hypothetical protein [Inoviridae sp.]